MEIEFYVQNFFLLWCEVLELHAGFLHGNEKPWGLPIGSFDRQVRTVITLYV